MWIKIRIDVKLVKPIFHLYFPGDIENAFRKEKTKYQFYQFNIY